MPSRSSRFTLLAKIFATLLAIGVADALFQDFRIGSWLGGLSLGWVALLAILRPALRRGPPLIALSCATVFALIMVYQPNPLAWSLFWTALSIAVLLPRTDGFDDAWRWMVRLAAHAVTGPFSPVGDLLRLSRARPRGGRLTSGALAAMLALPIVMSILFIALFASANPVIAQLLSGIRLPSVGEVVFWMFVLAIVWPSLRPRSWVTGATAWLPEPDVKLPGTSLSSVMISLISFNLLFAIQNALDMVFLWSDASLPDRVTLADYAHSGAYPLIFTALLAGVFVLATMKPGTATAESPMVRRLVVLWVLQNVVLVASSILRTCDYIAVYMLTPWRIAALAWMGLVALGLILICWRMLRGWTARRLINANALAAAIVLTVASIVDLDAVSAEWNVHHAGEAGVPLDLCQLGYMGSSSVLPLIEIERRPASKGYHDQIVALRNRIFSGDPKISGALVLQQADWRLWTWRDARRLERARALLGDHPERPAPLPVGYDRGCDGAIFHMASPEATPAANPAPLTEAPAQ